MINLIHYFIVAPFSVRMGITCNFLQLVFFTWDDFLTAVIVPKNLEDSKSIYDCHYQQIHQKNAVFVRMFYNSSLLHYSDPKNFYCLDRHNVGIGSTKFLWIIKNLSMNFSTFSKSLHKMLPLLHNLAWSLNMRCIQSMWSHCWKNEDHIYEIYIKYIIRIWHTTYSEWVVS